VTVVDTSVVVDYLLMGEGELPGLVRAEGEVAAPDVVVFEVLAVLRRQVHRGDVDSDRAGRAVARLRRIPLALSPTLVLAARAWELRQNVSAADALFVALAEQLEEPLVTKDAGLAAAARAHSRAVVQLAG
jgi:predicted nucleic acid-binding protein